MLQESDEVCDDSAKKDVQSRPEPSHWSKIDLKQLKVSELRDELEARGLNSKGLKSQLVAR